MSENVKNESRKKQIARETKECFPSNLHAREDHCTEMRAHILNIAWEISIMQ